MIMYFNLRNKYYNNTDLHIRKSHPYFVEYIISKYMSLCLLNFCGIRSFRAVSPTLCIQTFSPPLKKSPDIIKFFCAVSMSILSFSDVRKYPITLFNNYIISSKYL